MGSRGSHSRASRRANSQLRNGLREQKAELSVVEQWRILKDLFKFNKKKPGVIIIVNSFAIAVAILQGVLD